MNELDPRIEKGEKIITLANRAILDKEKLTSVEVKWYLSQDLMARTIFAEVRGSPSPVDSVLQKALGGWDSNRERALTHLLYLVEQSQKKGIPEMMEACARCAITLVHEPLIPDSDLGKYREVVDVAIHVIKLETERRESAALCSAISSGLLYNTARFNPQILLEMFSDVITEETVKDFQDAFSSDLEVLQGRLFGSGN